MCGCDSEELPITSTFKYEAADMRKDGHDSVRVGGIQMQYRGNVPFTSGYQHNPEVPFLAAMEHKDGGVAGLLSTATCVARSYFMGLETPMLAAVQFKIKSPDYDGKVICDKDSELTQLMAALDANNRVTTRLFLGPQQICVQGYTLIGVGYDNSWLKCGKKVIAGGKSAEVKSATSKTKVEEIVAIGKEGAVQTLWELEFYMEDPEIPILARDNIKDILKFQQLKDSGGDKRLLNNCEGGDLDKYPFPSGLMPPFVKYHDFYYSGGREKVLCQLQCVRVWKFPCKFDKEKKVCCSCPYKERPRQTTVTAADLAGKPPNQIIMCIGKRTIDNN